MDAGVVRTSAGEVRGVSDRGIWSFKGVRYGDDTGGPERFRPPRPPRPWTGVRDGSSYGPSCPQMSIEQMLRVGPPPEAERYMGVLNAERSVGEDCLALNVWTAELEPDRPRPVVVWLHGGGWSTGSASWPLYDFTNLAHNRDLVVVSINHRVGILGFLDLSRFDDAYADSGNVGMLDVVAALEWVRDNIAGFGGDPGNVTVLGESGGGAKTSTLLAMPAARGLFHKAFIMSGVMARAQLPGRAAENSSAVLEHLGTTDPEGLASVPADRLIGAEVALPGRASSVLSRGRGFSPVLGSSLPDHPLDAVAAGSSRGVAVVSGCTTDEVLAFLAGEVDLWMLDDDGLRRRLRDVLGDDTDHVLDRYRAARPDDSPASLLIAIATDARFRIPHVRLAEAIAAGGSRSHLYLFAFGHPDPDGRIRALHGLDMPYVFDNVDVAPIADGPHAAALVGAVSGALASLAHTDRPGHDGLPEWPAYTAENRATMRFDVECTVVDDAFGAERRCWDGVDVGGLTPG